MKINEQELEHAALETGLSLENAHTLWRQLQTRSEVEAHFEPAHVGYYFGALLVIGAMGWFITNGWDSFRGWQLFAIAGGMRLSSSLPDSDSGHGHFSGFPPACSSPSAFV